METGAKAAERPMQHYSLAQLEELLRLADEQATHAKGLKQNVQSELAERYGVSLVHTMDISGKNTANTMEASPDGSFQIKGERKKTVKWDSAKLMAVAQTLPWDRVSALFKITFEVGEKIYDGVKAADPALAAKLDEARTVTIGSATLTLERVQS